MHGRADLDLVRPLFRTDWLPDGMAHRTCGSHPGERSLIAWEGPLTGPMAPGGWISVTVRSLKRPEEVARQVVAGLTWQNERVTVPFGSFAVPPRATLVGVELRTWDGRWLDAQANYLVSGSSGEEGSRADLSIGVSNGMYDGDGSDLGGSSTRVDGRVGAAVEGPKGMGAYRVAQLSGCRDCVAEVGTESRAALTAVGGRAGALRLAASLRVVPDPAEPRTWRPL